MYVFDLPTSRKGQARRFQDHSSWQGPGVIVCVERDRPIPSRARLRGRVKAFPLEKLRLATADEMMGSQFITKALADVEASLQDGTVTVEGQEADEPNEAAPAAETAPKSKAKRVRKLSVSSSSDYADGDTPMDPEAEARAKRLDDMPFSVRQHMLRKAEEATLPTDPHELDFLKKRRMFGQLAKQLEPPYTLQEAGIRDRSS